MSIYLDNEQNRTICICNSCGTTAETETANGVVQAGWGTGQLWIDLSLSNIRQAAICFCPECWSSIIEATSYAVVAS
jgi:hypothetical protein